MVGDRNDHVGLEGWHPLGYIQAQDKVQILVELSALPVEAEVDLDGALTHGQCFVVDSVLFEFGEDDGRASAHGCHDEQA